MHTAQIIESLYIPADPEVVYGILADYHVGHPAILPKPYFAELRVLKGGYGLGTLMDVDMEVFGVKRTMRLEVVEDEPGHLLLERDVNTGTETKFIFEKQGAGTLLTFDTKMNFAAGIGGFFEKLTTPMITHHIYRKELQNIADYVQQRQLESAF